MVSARVSRLRRKAVEVAQTRQETCRHTLAYVRGSAPTSGPLQGTVLWPHTRKQ